MKFKMKNIIISISGLGYVGLPVAVSFSKKNYKIIGYDTNEKRVNELLKNQDVTGEVSLPSGTEMVMPGDDAKFTVKLITPIAMSEKLNFAIREGGRTVGAGVVTKIIE